METECHAVRVGEFSRDDTIIAELIVVIGLMMAGVGKLIGGW